MSFSAVHEFELSTGVEYCCSGHFLSPDVLHLAVAGGAVLEVYEFVEGGSATGFHLRYVRAFDFFGTVQSLETVPPGAFSHARLREDRDALLVAFDYGKFSVVQLDPLGSAMDTLEIIDMEDKPFNASRYRVRSTGQGKGTHLSALTTVRMDPEHRCCATLLYDSQLCLFPFQGKLLGGPAPIPPRAGSMTADGEVDLLRIAAAAAAAAAGGVGGGAGLSGAGAAPSAGPGTGPSGSGSGGRDGAAAAAGGGDGGDGVDSFDPLHGGRLVDGFLQFALGELGVDGTVRDAVFLAGFFQPTLMLLHQPLATGNPLLYMRTNSYVATLVTFDLAAGTFATVWRLDDLPHDSLQLVPVPTATAAANGGAAEGAILVTTNSLYYLHPRYCSGAHLNGFSDFSAGKLSEQFPVTRYHFGATLDAARFMFLNSESSQASNNDDNAAGNSGPPAPQKLLVAKRDGLLSVVTLVPNPMQPASVARLDVAIAARVTIPCCLCPVGPRHVFLGSRMGDSQLLAVQPASAAAAAAGGGGGSGDADAGPDNDAHVAKRARRRTAPPGVLPGPGGADAGTAPKPEEEEAFLYDDQAAGGGGCAAGGEGTAAAAVAAVAAAGGRGSTTAAAATANGGGVADATGVASTGGADQTGITLRAVDWLESRATGPVVSAAVGNVGDVYTDEFELLAAAGRDKCGALYKIRHGQHVECVATIVDEPPATAPPYLRVEAFTTAPEDPAQQQPATYVALSSAQSTVVLRAGDGALVNVAKPLPGAAGASPALSDEDNGVHRVGGETLAMGRMLGGRRVVQVYQEVRGAGDGDGGGDSREFNAGVRLLDAALGPLQELLVHDEEEDGGMGVDKAVAVRAVRVADHFVALLLADGGVKLVYTDEDDELCCADPEGLVPPDVDDDESDGDDDDDDDDDAGGSNDDDDDDSEEADPAELTVLSFFSLSAADSRALFPPPVAASSPARAPVSVRTAVATAEPGAVFSDELLLYGDEADSAVTGGGSSTASASSGDGGDAWTSSGGAGGGGGGEAEQGGEEHLCHFCTVAWSDGSVQVYGMTPGTARLRLLFQCIGIADAAPLLCNKVSQAQPTKKAKKKRHTKRRRPPALVVDAVVAPLSDCTGFNTRVLAATLDTGALRVYEFRRGPRGGVMAAAAAAGAALPPLFLARVTHRHVVHEGPRRHSGLRRSRAAAAARPVVEEEAHSGFRPRTLVAFASAGGGRAGLFHCARGRAAWVLVARGAVRVLAHNNAAFSALARAPGGGGAGADGLGNGVVAFAALASAALFGSAHDPHGFVACSRRGHVALFQVPDDLPPDAYREELTVARCAALRCTPHQVVYLHKAVVDKKPAKFIVRRHRLSDIDLKPYYAVACSELVAYAPAKLKVVDPRLDLSIQRRELVTPSKKFGMPRVWVERHSVRLMRDGRESVGQFKLHEFEHVLAMELLHLRDSKFMPTRPFLAVGTAYQSKAGFHAEAAGRLILLSVGMSPDDNAASAAAGGGGGGGDAFAPGKKAGGAGAVAAAAGAAAKQQSGGHYERTSQEPCVMMNFEFELDLNAPCSAICQVADHVVVGMGPKIRVYRWYKRELEMCGFYDSRIYAVALRSVKDTYVALADVAFSVQFMKWDDTQTTVVPKSEDQLRLPVFAANFLVHGRKLGVVATDAYRNMQILEYAPQDLRSGHKGHRLLTPAATHLGSLVATLEPQDLHACRYQGEGRGAPKDTAPRASSSSSSSSAAAAAVPPLAGLLFATLDGGFGSVLPIPERDFRRLERLQRQMASRALGHHAGCNPRYFREYRQGDLGEVRVHDRPMLDGRLLWKFADLDAATQRELAYHSGDADVDVLLSNLAEMRGLAGF